MLKLNLLRINFIFCSIFFINPVFSHGKVSLETDACVRHANGTMVHLSTYQPQYDPDAEYCTEIPNTGDTLFVVDLVDETLRSMPVAVQILKGKGEFSETVSSYYSTNHSDGVIKGAFNLDEGAYIMRITGEGIPPLYYEYPLRIQMFSYFDSFRKFLPYFILVVFLTWASSKIINNKQLRIRR